MAWKLLQTSPLSPSSVEKMLAHMSRSTRWLTFIYTTVSRIIRRVVYYHIREQYFSLKGSLNKIIRSESEIINIQIWWGKVTYGCSWPDRNLCIINSFEEIINIPEARCVEHIDTQECVFVKMSKNSQNNLSWLQIDPCNTLKCVYFPCLQSELFINKHEHEWTTHCKVSCEYDPRCFCFEFVFILKDFINVMWMGVRKYWKH